MARRLCITLDWQNLSDREKLFRQVEIADASGSTPSGWPRPGA
jgi:hypothetical protein